MMDSEDDTAMEWIIHPKKGLTVLIVNTQFGDKKEDFRPGAEKDIKNMKEIFETKLKFQVELIQNSTKRNLLEKLQEISQLDILKDVDCLVCVISTHGNETQVDCHGNIKRFEHCIMTTDGSVKTNDVLEHFDEKHCQALKGKPKLFFIQACRVREEDFDQAFDIGTKLKCKTGSQTREAYSEPEGNTGTSETDIRTIAPNSPNPPTNQQGCGVVLPPCETAPVDGACCLEADDAMSQNATVRIAEPLCKTNFLVMSSCISNAVSWSYDDNGGWLIYNLHGVFNQKIQTGNKFKLSEALTEVTHRVARNCESLVVDENNAIDKRKSYKKCTPMLEHKLTYEIYFKVI